MKGERRCGEGGARGRGGAVQSQVGVWKGESWGCGEGGCDAGRAQRGQEGTTRGGRCCRGVLGGEGVPGGEGCQRRGLGNGTKWGQSGGRVRRQGGILLKRGAGRRSEKGVRVRGSEERTRLRGRREETRGCNAEERYREPQGADMRLAARKREGENEEGCTEARGCRETKGP